MLVACSSSVEETTPKGGIDQLVMEGSVGSAPLVLLVVVDDGSESEALRDSIELDTVTDELVSMTRVSDGMESPGTWVAVDARAFVVHSSRPFDVVGPITLQTVRGTDVDVRTFASSILDELRRPSSAPATNRLLLAAASATRLVDGRRLASNSDEARIVGALPAIQPWRYVSLVSARDDESAGAPEDYTLRSSHYGRIELLETISVLGDDGNAPRLAAWERVSLASSQSRPELFPGLATGYSCEPPRPVALDPTGAARCRVTISAPGLSSCASSRGHVDLASRPTWASYGFGAERVCEVQQLSGAALDLCLKNEDPNASGFCLAAHPNCMPSVRFVGPSAPYATGGARVSVTCDLAP